MKKMKRKAIAILLTMVMLSSFVTGCAVTTGEDKEKDTTASEGTTGGEQAATSDQSLKDREEITMWFWGAEPYAQEAMQKILVEPYNASQDKYQLVLEFRATVDSDISTALAANQGPDIIYGSGPAFVMPLVEAGKLESMDVYTEQYGWADRILEPYYQSGMVNDSLYSLSNSVSTLGVFYNKKVLSDNGWEVPTTIEELESIMDQAIEKGMYGNVAGNKDWQAVNANYVYLFMTHITGADTIYECLTNQQPWTNEDVYAGIEKTKEWWDKGYLGGDDYPNLNYSDCLQLLATEQSPFFIGPSLAYQWAASYFTGDIEENIAFIPFPATETVPDETYTLGTACTLSINANISQEHKDESAKIIDMMMTADFMEEMTTAWPGYWGTPLKDLSSVDTSNMPYLSQSYVEVAKSISEAVNQGNFGYDGNVFFPPATQQHIIDVEDVWYDTVTVADFLEALDTEFKTDYENGMVPAIPKPGE